jgi:cell division protein FtsL
MPRAATAAARAVPAPRRAPQSRPARRSSGPARAGAVAAPGARALPLPQRLEFPRLAPSAASLLDRLLRGRAWVLLIGALLGGIVFFNVDVLRLNRSIASTSEKATALKQENARLLLLEAKLASSERIQQAAAADGMVLPAPGEVHYLRAGRGDAVRASERITVPQPVPPPAATPQTQQPPGTAVSAAPPATATQPTGTSGTVAPTQGSGTAGAQATPPAPTTQAPTSQTGGTGP